MTRRQSGFLGVVGVCFSLGWGGRIAQASSPPPATILEAHSAALRSVAWSADGARLVTAAFDGVVRVWDPDRLPEHVEIAASGVQAYWALLSSNGRLGASGYSDGTVKVWDPKTGAVRKSEREHKAAAWAGALTPDGDRLVTGGPDGALRFWALPAARVVHKRVHPSPVGWMAMAPDGKAVAVTSQDGFVSLYDVRSGDLLRSFGNHPGGVYDVAFSKDGTLLATAGADKSAKIWRLADGSQVHQLPHFGQVYAVVFSPDGATLATADDAWGVKLWDVATGAFRTKFTGAAAPVWHLAFAPDGDRLALAVGDGTVIVWRPADDPASGSRDLPETVDLRPRMKAWDLEVVAQHQRGTCSVHTFTRGLEFALSRRRDRGTPLSDEFLNWACNQVIGNVGPTSVDRGQFFEHLWMGCLRHGICLRERMPWKVQFEPGNAPSRAALSQAADLRDTAFTWREVSGPNLPAAEIVRRVKSVLAAGWPLIAGSSHSVFVVGYVDDANDPGGGRFLIADSGTGGFVDTITPDRLHSAIAYSRVEDYGFGWIEAHDPLLRIARKPRAGK